MAAARTWVPPNAAAGCAVNETRPLPGPAQPGKGLAIRREEEGVLVGFVRARPSACRSRTNGTAVVTGAGRCSERRNYRQVMRMKTVKDVMSTLPVWVNETASFREIAARLRECRVSAFPVLDAHGKVTGVVSEADLLVKEAVLGEPGGIAGLLAGLLHRAAQA